jgi:hypothetical protein
MKEMSHNIVSNFHISEVLMHSYFLESVESIDM